MGDLEYVADGVIDLVLMFVVGMGETDIEYVGELDNDVDDDIVLVTYPLVGFTLRDIVDDTEYVWIFVLTMGVAVIEYVGDDELDTDSLILTVACWELLEYDELASCVYVRNPVGD